MGNLDEKYPQESISSPCLMDYFVYNVVGRQFCKESLIFLLALMGMSLNGILLEIRPARCVINKGLEGFLPL